MSIGLQLLVAFALVLLNGFFVAAEFSLVKVRSTRLAELANEGKAAARMAQHAIHHFDVYLSCTQLGITLASLALGAISEPVVGTILAPGYAHFHLAEHWQHIVSFMVGLGTISMFHMVVGELVPKSIAIQRTEELALLVAFPLHWFYVMFRPAIWVINGLARLVYRLLRISPVSEQELVHSEEELRMILTASGESGVLKDSEVDLVQHVFEFADKIARDIMVPRVDMVYMDATWPVARNRALTQEHTYTRYPLCEGDPDHVIGMIHVKDFVRLRDGEDIRKIRREILFVPETKSIDQLLREFQLRKMHMATVVDEYGGTAGIVTLEDVLEEIVGEIHDEFEEARPEVQALDADRFLVDGKTALLDLKADYGIDIPPSDSETIGGWVLDMLGAIPEEGTTIESDGYVLKVEELDGQRVRKVLIIRTQPRESDVAAAH